MIIMQVDPKKVRILQAPHKRDCIYQATRLETEGQIEPLVVYKIPFSTPESQYEYAVDVDHDDYQWQAESIIQAACWLGWPSILVTY